MPGKGKFTKKEDRQIEHVKDSEKKRGLSDEEAERRAYGHVQNQKKGKASKKGK